VDDRRFDHGALPAVDGAARRLPYDTGLDFVSEVSMAKHFVANALGRIIDRSIRCTRLGYSTDTPLAHVSARAGRDSPMARRSPPDAHRQYHRGVYEGEERAQRNRRPL
jgi:hypothetical protein